MLPSGFAQRRAAHYYFQRWYFRRWREEGRIQCIQCILSITSRASRRRTGRHGKPSTLITGCQSVPSARGVGGTGSFNAFRGGPWPKTACCHPRAGIALGPGRLSGWRSRNAVSPAAARSGRLSLRPSENGFCRSGLSGTGGKARPGARMGASGCGIRRGDLWIFRRPEAIGRPREPTGGSEGGFGWTESRSGGLIQTRQWSASPCSASP